MRAIWLVFYGLVLGNVNGYYDNSTFDYSRDQLLDFKLQNPGPVGLWTTSEGEPVELRDTFASNSEFLNKQWYLDSHTHLYRERVAERVVHAKGVGAFGYFEVTNDVSRYTKADVFNGIGKKTPLVARLSTSRQHLGGTDLSRDFKGLAVKLYTKDGNLDFTCLNVPVFFLVNPIQFVQSAHTFRWNPSSNLEDPSMQWDFTNLQPKRFLPILWMMADYGLPRGYTKIDMFPIHTYELVNKHGETHYARFNFRTEQGLENFTSTEALAISAETIDYFNKDLYNAIKANNYPIWRLDIDVLSAKDIRNVNYDPFDMTKMWKNGTYHTVTIGRMVLNQFGDNQFRVSEQAAYNPGNLVPGIPGPIDAVFKSRRIFYRDIQNYRLGINHNNIEVNMPKHRLSYNRDGVAPVRDNMKDMPNYYPNSFNGPIPYVDELRAKKLDHLVNGAVDLQEISDFYNHILEDDDHRQRTADNVAEALLNVLPEVAEKSIDILTLAEPDLGRRIVRRLKELKRMVHKQTTQERYEEVAQCLERNMKHFSSLHTLS